MTLILQHWKLIAGIAYSIAVPVYFYITASSANKNLQTALETSQVSNQKQIAILQISLEDQRVAYEKMFNDYQEKMNAAQKQHDDELVKIKKAQADQQWQLSQKFKADPTAVNEELEKRFGLKK